MTNGKWNRRPKRSLITTKEDKLGRKFDSEEIFKVARLRVKKKKRKHPGYTLVPKYQHWIFNGNKINGG